MGWYSDILWVMCIIFGVMLLLRYRKRKFNRTNAFGVEQFLSYSDKVKSKTKDGLLAGLAIILTIFGVMMLSFRYADSWGWVVLIPALAILYGIWIPGRR